MIRLPGVPSVTSKIAQEKGRVLETVLRKGASVTISLRSPGVLNSASRNSTKGGILEFLCWEREPLLTISLRKRAFTN